MVGKQRNCENDNVDEGGDDFRKNDTGKYASNDEFSEEAYCNPARTAKIPVDTAAT